MGKLGVTVRKVVVEYNAQWRGRVHEVVWSIWRVVPVRRYQTKLIHRWHSLELLFPRKAHYIRPHPLVHIFTLPLQALNIFLLLGFWLLLGLKQFPILD